METHFQTFSIRRKFIVYLFSLTLPIIFFLTPHYAQAWGMRGHGLICEAAIHLVKNKELKRLLTSKTTAITYLCNLPDTYWRELPEGATGAFTHYFEPDIVSIPIQSIPSSYLALENLAKGKLNLNTKQPVISVSRELGSSWWRADQFLRLSLDAAKKATASGVKTKDDEDVYQMWVMMGLMGHFVGDNSQPFHNTRDYDGWIENQGGIHHYYENSLVDELPRDILTSILNSAPTAQSELKLETRESMIEQMRALSILSYDDIQTVLQLDPVITKSTTIIEKGMEIRKEAERKKAEEVINQFNKILISHLSRGAVLLAWSWDHIFDVAGRPPVEKDHSFKFPHKFGFIPPDYTSSNNMLTH